MTTPFKFSAYNSQAIFGWGDEKEAEAYAEHLNRDREINTYSYQEVTDAEEIAKLDAGYGDQVNLKEALQAIKSQDY
jgi:hypothetical protein